MSAQNFSAQTRQANLQRLGSEQFDLLIIGGGITGAGIARDAAMRGFKTALVEKGDFASGTSSRSSKLVHGGVRYLEMFEFGLVFEASRERHTLHEIAPHLVQPLPFLFPVYRDARWPAWMINIGLWMYDGLALFRNFKTHTMMSNRQVKEMLHGIDTTNIRGSAMYYDAQVDDARLTLETIRLAHRHDAVIANYVQVSELLKDNGQVIGARAHDVITGAQTAIHARVVVNATGPWVDLITHLDDPHAPKRMRPTKGIHIIVPCDKLGCNTAVAFPAQSDGRLMFVIPWGAFSIIGTTESDFDGEYNRVYANRADVEYVIAAVNHAFPESPIQKSDVISTYAGWRPLVSQVGKSLNKTSREHEIWWSESGLLTIAGGKLTTYRSMAEQLVDTAAKRLHEKFNIVAARPCMTAQIPLIEGNGASPTNGFNQEIVAHLEHTYGPERGRVIEVAKRMTRFEKPLVAGLPYLWAEAQYALEDEMAITLDDVLARRTHILNEARDNGIAIAPELATHLAQQLGWGKARIEKELRAYQDEVGLVTAFR